MKGDRRDPIPIEIFLQCIEDAERSPDLDNPFPDVLDSEAEVIEIKSTPYRGKSPLYEAYKKRRKDAGARH